MAKSHDTFQKRQKQKKQLERKAEKKEKKEQRKAKAEHGKPLEAMLAFVDENGNLTDTPPDPEILKSIL